MAPPGTGQFTGPLDTGHPERAFGQGVIIAFILEAVKYDLPNYVYQSPLAGKNSWRLWKGKRFVNSY